MTFPTDDVTLAMLESACHTEGDEPSHLIDFLSFGSIELEPYIHVDPETGDEYEFKMFAGGYSPPEAILALIEEIRRLRNADIPPRRNTRRRAVGVLVGRVRTMLGRRGDGGLDNGRAIAPPEPDQNGSEGAAQ